jgi:DNA-binding IscR family transcriptional regulator
MVGEIHRLIDGPLAPAPCASVTQHRTCDWCENEATCELKPVWTRVRDAIAEVMDSTSLGDLMRQTAIHQAPKYAI